MGVMFCVDVWIMVTIGQSTTTAISTRHGPIQGSGPRRRQIGAAGTGRRDGGAGTLGRPAVSSTAVLSDMLTPGLAVAGAPAWPQPPLVAVCWIVLRICCGLPVMAWPSVVLIWFSTVVQFGLDG